MIEFRLVGLLFPHEFPVGGGGGSVHRQRRVERGGCVGQIPYSLVKKSHPSTRRTFNFALVVWYQFVLK